MQVYILTELEYGEREIVMVSTTREEINEYIVEQVLAGVTFSEPKIDDYEVAVTGVGPQPKDNDYIIDGAGDRWDYFPDLNQYKLRTHPGEAGKYNEELGSKSGAWISEWYGIKCNYSNGVDTARR